ncbi:MAG: type II toxin-antitoxin system VapC family toxin [Oceanipulchritudo sp.]
MALKYLLDTSVFSQPIRPKPNLNCQRRWQKHGDAQLAVPAMAIAELEYGLFLKDSDRLWSAYRSILKDRLQLFDFSAAVASVFGEIKSSQTRSGRTVDDFDLAIAATAIAHDLTVATLNARHFQLIDDLRWEDWSSAL